MSDGKPIAVDLEVRAVVGWDHEEFDAAGDKGEPHQVQVI